MIPLSPLRLSLRPAGWSNLKKTHLKMFLWMAGNYWGKTWKYFDEIGELYTISQRYIKDLFLIKYIERDPSNLIKTLWINVDLWTKQNYFRTASRTHLLIGVIKNTVLEEFGILTEKIFWTEFLIVTVVG